MKPPAEILDGPALLRASPTALDLPVRQRLAMVLFGYIPFLNAAIVVTFTVLASLRVWPGWTWILGPAWLLLVPPIVVRLTLRLRPIPDGDIALDSSDFMTWWLTAQWQTIFNRLPWIEEIIRLVPGLYVTWLRLWGARVGRLVYWTPGLRILDRSIIDIGDRVAFGAGVRLNPHVIMPDAAGRLVLRIGTIRIGDDALVGGYSLLLAGCWIGQRETSPGERTIRPFTGWVNGRRAPAATGGSVEEDPA